MTTQDQAALQEQINRLLTDHPPALGQVMEHLSRSGGKHLRGNLAILCAGVGKGHGKQKGAELRDKLVSLASAIEILHLATLVHDDVIDDADLRRGLPSVQKRFGKKVAVMAGDYLFTVCFQVVSREHQEQMPHFARVMARICDGEIMQYQNNKNVEMSVLRYLRIISRKTGILFACAAVAGAKTAGAKDPVITKLSRFAMHLGMVFQIVDDCLDFSGSPESLAKSVHKDIDAGIVTLPMIYAFQQRPELKERMGRETLNDQDVQELVRGVQETDGIGRSMELAAKYRDKAKVRLDLLPEFDEKEQLYRLLENSLHRTR